MELFLDLPYFFGYSQNILNNQICLARWIQIFGIGLEEKNSILLLKKYGNLRVRCALEEQSVWGFSTCNCYVKKSPTQKKSTLEVYGATIFTKRNNFCVVLYASVGNETFQKEVCSSRKEFTLKGVNSFFSELIPITTEGKDKY